MKEPAKGSTDASRWVEMVCSNPVGAVVVLGFGLLYELTRRDAFDRSFSPFVIVSMFVHGGVGFALLSRRPWSMVVFTC